MKRTTIYLEPDLELSLKREAARRGTSAADLIREALRAYLQQQKQEQPVKVPPGAGAFKSGRKQTAARAEEVLASSKFGES